MQSCPECGAAVKPGSEVCDLCGTSLREEERPEEVYEAPAEEEFPTPEPARSAEGGVFCNHCGWHNPQGARFCSMCGSELQDLAGVARVTSPVRKPTLKPDQPIVSAGAPQLVGRKVGIIVAASVMLVLALFLVTVASKGRSGGNATEAAAPDSADAVAAHENLPLEPVLQRQADSLSRVIDGLSGPQKMAVQSDLVGLFIQNGRLDRAAIEQEKIARETGTPEAWTKTGNLYFDWMETIQGQHKVEVSRLAVAAYQQVLEKEPDNLDVRTDMAWAYQYDPAHSMEAINQTNTVLEKNPNHLQANFNKGVFLIQINRLDQALQQFEKVRSLAKQGTPEFERAESAIGAVKDMQNKASS